MDRESLRLLLAQGVSVEEIGRRFAKSPATVSYWLKKFGLEAPNREKYAAKGGIERERLDEFVGRGLSIAEIAAEIGLSKTTVRHWLAATTSRRRPKPAARPYALPRPAGMFGSSDTARRTARPNSRSRVAATSDANAAVERVMRRRRKLKELLVAEAGGRCSMCGYDRHVRALEFHHVDPETKRFQISWNGVTQSLETLRREASKCVLLCSNCHAEVEDGVATLPARVSPTLKLDAP